MGKLFKFVFWLLAVLVLVVVIGGFIFIKTFDLNTYKTYAEQIVYQQTGRKLALNGNAGLKISLTPTIQLNDVSLSNASWWVERPDMIKAQMVEVSLSVLPLLHKQIVIESVTLINPEVYLGMNKEGQNNWTFEKQGIQYAAAEPVVATDAMAAGADVPLSLVAKKVRIENGIVVYQDLKTNSKTDLRVNNFEMTAEDMESAVNASFDLFYNGEGIVGTATTGSIQSLLQNMPNFPVKANVKAYGAKVGADVKLSGLMDGNISFDGKVSAENPSGNFGAPAVSVEALLSGTPQNIVVDLKPLTVAGNNITGQIKADLSKEKPYVNAVLQSPKFDLQTISAPAQKAQNLFVTTAYAAEFVPDTPLDLSALKMLNADVKVTIQKLIINDNISLDNLNTIAKINNGVLSVNPLSMAAGGGTIDAQATVNANQNNMNVNIKGQNIVLQNLLKDLAINNDKNFGISSGGKTDLSINLSGQGTTVRKLVESLDGQIVAVVGESKIQTGSLKYLEGNFVSQLLKTLNIQRKEKQMTVQCAVVRTDIKNGNASFPKGIVFNAKDLTVVSNGSVNLQNDKIDLTIHPFNGKIADTNVVQALSSLIKISGTIENPRLTLDNSAVIKNVVGVAAAGPAFLGSQMLLDVDETPCYTALKGTSYQNMFPAPSGVKAAGQGVYQGANDAISEGVDMLTDTAKGVLNLLSGKKK